MDAPARPAPATREELAHLLDFPLLDPSLTAADMLDRLSSCKRNVPGGVVLRPRDVEAGVRALQGSALRIAAVCGFPHGTQTTASKLYEARDLLRRGAREIHAVVGVAQLLSREFQQVQTELLQLSELCRKEGAVFGAILECSYLPDELRIIACRAAERADVHLVKTSTGFAPGEITAADVKLLRHHLPEEIGVIAVDPCATLDRALEWHALGATRIETSSAAAILQEWTARHASPSVS